LGHPPATLRVEDGLLVPTPATASVVQAVEMRAAGATYREIQEATGFKQTKTFRVCRYWKGREDELRTIWGRRA